VPATLYLVKTQYFDALALLSNLYNAKGFHGNLVNFSFCNFHHAHHCTLNCK